VEVEPGNTLELLSQPQGPVVIRGRGNVLRVGRNVALRASLWIAGDGSTIEIGDGCELGGTLHVVRGGATVRIGARTLAGDAAIALHEPGEILIGADCMISSDVRMDVSDMHPIYDRRTGERLNPPRPIHIADRVWVGSRALVLKGARIGEGAIVGAGAMVVGRVPAGCIVAGVPAKVIRRDVVWRPELEGPSGRPLATKVRPMSLRARLPRWLPLHMARPFPGAPPAREPSFAEALGQPLSDLPPGATARLARREGFPAFSLDGIGAAFDPLNRQPARTSGVAPIEIRGFAFDQIAMAPSPAVDVVIDGVPYAARHGRWRVDVADSYGDQALGDSGFSLVLAARALAPGPHTAAIRAVSADGKGYYEAPTVPFEVE